MQSKCESLIEVTTSTLIGYAFAVVSQILIFPLFDINVPVSDNLLIGAYFTAISLVRGFCVRRWFNKK